LRKSGENKEKLKGKIGELRRLKGLRALLIKLKDGFRLKKPKVVFSG
jgi:hypothetical protein